MNKKDLLEAVYYRYHKKEFIHPDPLEFVLKYDRPGDMEIAGLIASSFATGRVNSILDTVSKILHPFPSLKEDLLVAERGDLEHLFGDFRYRFYSSESLVDFLSGIRETVIKYGSLENCFLAGYSGRSDGSGIERLLRGLSLLAGSIGEGAGSSRRVLPDPGKGSALKRLNMFLRWMIRRDEIDPGPWSSLSPSILIIPLDTHIMQLSRILGFTSRNQSDLRTAVGITEVLRTFDSDDPVKYDFSLSRLGIHPDLSYDDLAGMF